MNLHNKVVVITGAAGGIGTAVAKKMAEKGAKLVLSDLNEDALSVAAEQLNALPVQCDVTDEASIQGLIAQAEAEFGQVDLFFSNAGYADSEPSHAASASNQVWQKNWELHVMAHVYASRALLPKMIERGEGYLVNVASAAGLLSQVSDAAYTSTKHAAVAFAESLAISHMDDGVNVSVVCPQYVNTDILGLEKEQRDQDLPGVITPEQCAETIVNGIEKEEFMILTHPEVYDYMQHRANNTQRWLSGMRRYRRALLDENGKLDFGKIFSL